MMAKPEDFTTPEEHAAYWKGCCERMSARNIDLTAERDEARQIVRDIYWMALRYADGRRTYSVGLVNDAVRKGYNAGWLKPKDEGGDPITPRFARDGMGEAFE